MKYSFDLQMFAEPVTPVVGLAPENLNPNTIYQNGVMVKENGDPGDYNPNLAAIGNKAFYEGLILDEAGPNLVYAQFGQKAQINRTHAEWRKYAALPNATTPLKEGVTPDGTPLSISTITAHIKQYGAYVTTSDIVNLTSIDPLVTEATKVLGAQAGVTLDTLIRNELVSGTNVMYVGGASSRSALTTDNKIDRATIVRGVRALRGQNTPTIDGAYVFVIHPDNEADIMLDSEFVEVYKYRNDKMLFEGEIGTVGGARIVVSTQTKIWKEDDKPGVYGCLMFGANAYGVVNLKNGGLEHFVKPLGSAGAADPLNQRATVGWKASQASKILNEKYILRIECCSEVSDTAAEN